MKEKKFFLFDLDGTLLNNTRLGFARVNKNLDLLGLPPIDENFLRQHWGMPAKDLWQLICLEIGATEEQQKAFQTSDLYLAKTREHSPELSTELINAITSLKHFGLFTGILTSRTGLSLEAVVEQTGLPLEIFDYVQTITHFPHHKPSGRVFGPAINWARVRALTPKNIVYFGDTVNYDYAATLNSEPPLDFVGVASGVNTYDEFLAAGLTTCRITTFEKLPDLLHRTIKEVVEA